MPPQTLLRTKVPFCILPHTHQHPPPQTAPVSLSVHLTHSPSQSQLTLTISDLSTRLLHLYNVETANTYPALRESQSLRIDFSAFPAHLADLLRRPITDDSFIAILLISDDTSINPLLRLLELSHYKTISHLDLSLTHSTQPELLAALADRAREADASAQQAAEVENQLALRNAELKALRGNLSSAEAAIAAAGAAREKAEHDLQEALREKMNRHDADSQRLHDEIAMLQARLADIPRLRAEMEDLQRAMEEAVAAEKMTTRQLDTVRAERDRAAEEIRKGNIILGKVQAEVRVLRGKGRVKANLIQKLEMTLQEEKGRCAGLERDIRRERDRRALLEVEKEGLADRLKLALGKLEENRAVLDSDQQVITYLNRELNDRVMGDIGTGGTRGGSRSRTPDGTSVT